MRIALKIVVDVCIATPAPSEWTDVIDRFGTPSNIATGKDKKIAEATWGDVPDLLIYGSRAIGFGVKIAETTRSGSEYCVELNRTYDLQTTSSRVEREIPAAAPKGISTLVRNTTL